MYTIPSAHPAHFVMAILAAGAISVSLTSMAAITGLVSNPTASVRPPAFLKTLSSHLPGAAPVVVIDEAPAPVAAALREDRQVKTATARRRKHRMTAIAKQ